MCLILLAWQAHADYPLVVAANRDEFFARATATAAFWDDAPQVLAGRDLDAGGTWLGVTRQGRFAALTNYRAPGSNRTSGPMVPNAPSRGLLVSRFLTGKQTPETYLSELQAESERYNGYNLLFGDRSALYCYANRSNAAQRLAPGVYGLSNDLLDTPWPKIARGKSALAMTLQALPDEAPLFDLLHDDQPAPDAVLPRTGVSLEWERLLSAAFICAPDYGTRSSTVLLVDQSGELRFTERSFAAGGTETSRVEYAFALQ